MSQSNKFLLCHLLFLLLASAAAAEPHHRISGYQLRWPGCVPELAVTMNGQPLGTTVHDAQGGTVDVVVAVDSGLMSNTYRARHGVARSAEPNGMIDALVVPGDGAQRSAGLNGTMSMSVPAGAEAESFAYRRGHHVLHEDRWNRSTYEQAATGLASVPLVWIGQIPGPTIRAVQGAAADITVKNSPLTEHVPIHWHGIREIGTPLADGTEGSMQCPVPPGDTFMVDRPRTYHAHNGVQHSVELNGMIAVSVPARDTAVPFAYNREHTDVHLARYDMQRTMVVVSLPERVEAEPLVRDREHAGLVDYWWHTQGAGVAASVPLFLACEPAQSLSNDGRAGFNNSLSASGIRDATRPDSSPPPAFAVAAGKTHHITVTNLSGLNNSDSLLDRTVQSSTGSLLIALTVIVQVALDDRRKKNGRGGDAAAVAMALLILLAIGALPNASVAARPLRGGGGHDQAAVGPVAAAPVLTPQSKAAAGHSQCTNDPNTQDPGPCVQH